MAEHVAGYCPMGCGATLMLGAGGHVTCGYIPCPNPTAVDAILAVNESEHIVWFRRYDFSILHPLRERLGEELIECVLHVRVKDMDGPPVQVGKYRARLAGERWTWEALDA